MIALDASIDVARRAGLVLEEANALVLLADARLLARPVDPTRATATKEALVKGAWEQPRYHPHRDDRRLHVVVHRLRHLVERDPRAPEILLREGDTYRLGAPVRVGAVDR